MQNLNINVECWADLSADEQEQRLSRPRQATATNTQQTVKKILADIRDNGDSALLNYTRQFDSSEATSLRISQQRIEQARESPRQKSSRGD